MTREPTSPEVDAPHDDPEVVRVLEFYLAEVEAGRAPDRAALLARHPDIAGPLGDCLDGLDFLRKAGARPGQARPLTPPDEVLGDFRLLRTIGRGGMGIVYEAEQLSLGRRVAVKTLPFAVGANDAELRRFQHEARAAAALDHPHVVPVYAVGEDRGTHYFAMRLVPGKSLAELITRPGGPARTTRPAAHPATLPDGDTVELPPVGDPSDPLPTDARFLAGLILQAADALGHAHAVGVVHRDVKPANLLLEGNHLWVADFGLAFVPGTSRLTRSGAAVGTLRYMSPEQLDPRRGVTDQRADIYGLGATFYELLTLRPVFDEADRAAIVVQILNDDPTPPRWIDRAIPVALETVILKMLAKDPARRYASMAELADDLRRFLDGRPVLARRPTWFDRGLGWLARHRRLTVAAVVGTALLVALLSWNQARLTKERDNTAVAQRKASAAADDFYTAYAEQWLANEPRQEPRQVEFLTKALKYYEWLAEAPTATRADRLAAAVASRRVADISARLGRLADAEAAYALAADRLRALATAEPEAHDIARESAICANDRGNLDRRLGRIDAAGFNYKAAAERFRFLCDAGSADPFDRVGLAGVEANQGLLWQLLDKPAEAEACFRAARVRFAKLAAEFPRQPQYLAEAAACGHHLATLAAEAGRDANAEFRDALVLRERVAAVLPKAPAHRSELARLRVAYAEMLSRAGKADEAGKLLRPAVEAFEKLVDEFPDTPAYRAGLASALHGRAEFHAAAGRTADARQDAERAVALLRPMTKGEDATSAALQLAQALRSVGTADAAREGLALLDRFAGPTPAERRFADACRRDLDRLVRPDAGSR